MYKSKSKNSQFASVGNLTNLVKTGALSQYGSDLKQIAISGLESLGGNVDFTAIENDYAGAEAALLGAGLEALLENAIGPRLDHEEQWENSISAALAVGLQYHDADSFVGKYSSPVKAGNESLVLGSFEDAGLKAGVESFNRETFDAFVGYNMILAALSAGTNEFEEALFPTKVLSAGEHGIEMSVTYPYVYNSKARSGGKEFELTKTSLVNALRDATIMNTDSTRIYPYSIAENDAYLAATADVPAATKEVDGVSFETRPLKADISIDLLGVSAIPGLVDGTQNETDTLSPIMKLEDLYFKLTDNAGTPNVKVVKMATVNHPGATYARSQEGNSNRYNLNFDNVLRVEKASLGDAMHDQLKTVSGTSDEEIVLFFTTRAAGIADTQKGNVNLNYASIELAYVHSRAADGTETKLAEADYDNVKAAITAKELVGWNIDARRSNANLRQQGLLVNSGEARTYVLPNGSLGPLSSNRPISAEGYGMTAESLLKAQRVRSHNLAVDKLIDSFSMIESGYGTQNTSMQPGGELIIATALSASVDLTETAASMDSNDAIDNLGAAIVNAVSTMVARLLRESNYLAALTLDGNENDFEVVLATDSYIKQLIMKSGEGRTLGNGIKFRVVSSEDTRMSGSTYITFRRPSQKGNADPLSYGIRSMSPALITEPDVTRGGDTVRKEITLTPREQCYVTCPLIGRLDFIGLDSMFIDRNIKVS